MTTLVSDNFIYERIPQATDGRSYRTKLASEASSYELGETIRIAIPPVAHGFMNVSNTWLNIKMTDCTMATSATATINHSWIGISAAFDRVDFVGPNGQSINMQQHYQSVFTSNLLGNSDYSASFPNSLTNQTGLNQVVGDSQEPNGRNLPGTLAAGVYTADTIHYSPTLLGILSGQKSIPLTWFPADSYLEIYLTNDIKNIFHNSIAAGTITDLGSATFTVDLDCQIDVVTDNSLREIQQHAGFGAGPVSWSDTQQRSSLHSISVAELNSSTEFLKTNVIPGVRPRKLQNVIQIACRRNSTGHYDRWACVNPYTNWYIRLGTENVPPRPMASKAEMAGHFLSCYNQSSYSTYGNRLADKRYGTRFPNSLTAASANPMRGGVGIDLTQYDNSADGVDISNIVLETLGSLVTTIVADQSVDNYEVYSIKTYAVLYSIDTPGNFSISY